MGQILHGCARTTEAVRRAIQNSKESIASLARRYDLNEKTVAKWKKRKTTSDMAMGPKNPRSKSLTIEEEAMCVAFRRHSLLPLDDCLYALQDTIPHLTRSSLHRLFKRHGINRLPEMKGEVKAKKKFKQYPIGYFHIDIAEVRTEEGKLYMFVAIDRTSKFAYAALYTSQNRKDASHFLSQLVKLVPYKIHTILTDNGAQFCHQPRYRNAPTAQYQTHMFDIYCNKYGIEHRLTKPKHPWTNGQVERMNRTLKEATVKRYHYHSHEQLQDHLDIFLNAYNFAKRLKALKGLTPYEFILKSFQNNPEYFIHNPTHLNMGLNN